MCCAVPGDEGPPDARIQPESEVTDKFRVGLTRDILDARGKPAFGQAALAILDQADNVDWEYLPKVVSEIDADMASHYDALYVNIARVPATAVARSDCRLRVVARHGVGYDSVDVPAMTRANAYLVVDAGQAEYAAGEWIRVLMK